MPCSKSFRRGGKGGNDTFSMPLWTFGDSGFLDAKKEKLFGLLGVFIWNIYFFFLESRLECIGSVLGYPEG